VRGIHPTELDEGGAYAMGRAYVEQFEPKRIAVGRDMRVSGPVLSQALISGIRDQGADVVDIGLVSTDALYFAVGNYDYPAGVLITASHNPANYNGFKLMLGKKSFFGQDIQRWDGPPPTEAAIRQFLG